MKPTYDELLAAMRGVESQIERDDDERLAYDQDVADYNATVDEFHDVLRRAREAGL